MKVFTRNASRYIKINKIILPRVDTWYQCGSRLNEMKRYFSTQEESFGKFPVLEKIPLVSQAKFLMPEEFETIPCYRILNEDGEVRSGAKVPDIDRDTLIHMYSLMVRLNTMDNIFYDAQRQGRISFYMTAFGEEAIHIGSAAALNIKDTIFAQYREAGVLMWRGFTLEQFADQCFSNENDNGKGRQMPVHYGSRVLNYQTISSPLGTQIPQASGAAYAFKIAGENRIAVSYFGEGAASEGDFHPGLNFAATKEAPVLFFCRNNGFAISTPVVDQFRGDGIASRGLGYGIPAIRVDGNDLMAVYDATMKARKMIVEHGRPVLVEAMSYRQGHHSTSDDSTRYRPISEIKDWKENHNPISRLRKYLEKQGWWTEEQEINLNDTERKNMLDALQKAESKKKPPLESMFEDVYSEKPWNLKEQEKEMLQHLAKYPGHYNLTD